MLGLSLVTVNKIVDELAANGEILDMGQTESTGGRKAKQYMLNKNHKSILTALVRSGAVSCAIVNLIGEICYENSFAHDENWIDRLAEFIHIEDLPPVACVGVAVPGTVHDDIIRNIPTVPELEGIKLAEALMEKLGLPIIIENDINIAAMGACYRFAGDVSNMVFLYLDKGIGMGTVLRNEIYQSKRNFAGEIAYMYLGDCYDGKNIEQYILNCIDKGDISSILDILSKVLANVSCVLDPDVVVVDSPILKQEHLDIIDNKLSAIIGRDFLPALELSSYNQDIYYQGLYRLYMEKEKSFREER